MWYSITRNKDIFTITKTGVNPVSVSLYKQTSCNGDEFVQVLPLQETNTTIDIILPLEDAIYKIVISTVVGRDTETISILIPHYNNMLLSLIDDIDFTLCGCACKECDECNDENEKDMSMVLLKLISYYTLTNLQYSAFLNTAFKCLKCSIVDANQCILINEKVHGNAENTILFKKILSLYYLAFYYGEYKNTIDTEYIDEKFKFEKIKKCINNLGIDTECVLNTINEMGTFTITSTAYINQPPSQVGDISISVGNRAVTTLTSAMFTTSTTPPYSDPEGDSADAVRIDSLPAIGQLTFDSNPVTVGQIITIANINAGKLKYISPNQNPQVASSFNFSVRDSGSMIFIS